MLCGSGCRDDAPFGRGKVQRVQRGRLTGPLAPRVLKVLRFDGPAARGLWIAACGGNDYKASVTGIPFLSPVLHDEGGVAGRPRIAAFRKRRGWRGFPLSSGGKSPVKPAMQSPQSKGAVKKCKSFFPAAGGRGCERMFNHFFTASFIEMTISFLLLPFLFLR